MAGMQAGEPMAGMQAGEPMAGMQAGEPTNGCDPSQPTVDPCTTCDQNSTLIMPEFDDRCPSVMCSANEYEFDAQGSCVQTEYTMPSSPRCVGLGQCQIPEEQSCEIGNTTIIAEADDCREILSCEPNEMLEVSPRPNGSLCHEWGSCRNGECNALASCANFTRYNQQNFFCESELNDEGEALCMFFVNGRGLNDDRRTTCLEFCERDGGICVDGWNNDDDDSCRQGNGTSGCDLSYETQICVCRSL